MADEQTTTEEEVTKPEIMWVYPTEGHLLCEKQISNLNEIVDFMIGSWNGTGLPEKSNKYATEGELLQKPMIGNISEIVAYMFENWGEKPEGLELKWKYPTESEELLPCKLPENICDIVSKLYESFEPAVAEEGQGGEGNGGQTQQQTEGDNQNSQPSEQQQTTGDNQNGQPTEQQSGDNNQNGQPVEQQTEGDNQNGQPTTTDPSDQSGEPAAGDNAGDNGGDNGGDSGTPLSAPAKKSTRSATKKSTKSSSKKSK